MSVVRFNPGWRPKGQNQEADALTNEDSDLFDEQHRVIHHVILQYSGARQVEAIVDTLVGKPRFKGKRKRDSSPW